ncbi:hypothetical protein ACVWZW_004422 [Bradyrhizobium sp. F1.13.4]
MSKPVLRTSCPIDAFGVEICDDILESRDRLLNGCDLLKLVADRGDAAPSATNISRRRSFSWKGETMVG